MRENWVKSWVRRRFQLGAYQNTTLEFAAKDNVCIEATFESMKKIFKALVDKMRPTIQKDTYMQKEFGVEERVLVPLRYVATSVFCSIVK